MKVKKLAPQIFHVQFSNQLDMAKTFLRFQEHYESPKFKGKIFSLAEFKKWYKTTRHGRFTYYSDWGGFNIPSPILKAFYDGKFKRLSKGEKELLRRFRKEKGEFYIIATTSAESTTLNHEVSHARFYLNKSYSREIVQALSSFNLRPLGQILIKMGYDKSVLLDEIHAYLLNDWAAFSRNAALVTKYLPMAKTLKIIEQKYYPS